MKPSGIRDIALRMPVVHALQKGTFTEWLRSKGKLGGQHKVPRLSNERNIAGRNTCFNKFSNYLKLFRLFYICYQKLFIMKLLEGKVAIVTGAARGIGEAIAIKFAEHGANVAFTYVSDSSAEKAAALEEKLTALGCKSKSLQKQCW